MATLDFANAPPLNDRVVDETIYTTGGRNWIWTEFGWVIVYRDGERGPTGATGDQGVQGIPGDRGLTGPQGPVGPDGPQGLRGIQGEQGAQGNDGPMGPDGPQGDVGPQGERGLPGIQGDQGIQGPRGLPGEDGDRGETGIQGERGPTGDRGPAGSQGNIGPQGAQGPGITGVLDNGDGSVTLTFSNGQTVVQDIRGPQGDQGDQGIRGIQGPDGPVGPRGPRGDAGAMGDRGDTGATGDVGPAGPIGPRGEEGEQGVSILAISVVGQDGDLVTMQVDFSNDTISNFNFRAGGDGGGDGTDVEIITPVATDPLAEGIRVDGVDYRLDGETDRRSLLEQARGALFSSNVRRIPLTRNTQQSLLTRRLMGTTLAGVQADVLETFDRGGMNAAAGADLDPLAHKIYEGTNLTQFINDNNIVLTTVRIPNHPANTVGLVRMYDRPDVIPMGEASGTRDEWIFANIRLGGILELLFINGEITEVDDPLDEYMFINGEIIETSDDLEIVNGELSGDAIMTVGGS